MKRVVYVLCLWIEEHSKCCQIVIFPGVYYAKLKNRFIEFVVSPMRAVNLEKTVFNKFQIRNFVYDA